jgi:hypothetical protein
MELTLYKDFTPEQRRQFGPPRQAAEFTTRRRVYETPFLYQNVEIGDFYEIDPVKGVEFKADTGFLRITEDQPIVAATVVGSGCCRRGYVEVEWWEDGENVDHLDNQLVKRQRAEDLNGIHPSVWLELFRRANWAKGLTYEGVTQGEVRDAVDIFRRLTRGWHDNLETSFYENTVYFRVGTASHYPRKVTLRCGSKEPEDTGTSLERYPGDYAIRLVEVQVLA